MIPALNLPRTHSHGLTIRRGRDGGKGCGERKEGKGKRLVLGKHTDWSQCSELTGREESKRGLGDGGEEAVSYEPRGEVDTNVAKNRKRHREIN